MDILFGFPTTNCCDTYVSYEQTIMAEYYEKVFTVIDNLISSVFARSIYGRTTEMEYNRINDFHYLGILLFIIWKRRKEYFALNGTIQPLSEVYSIYRLQCIKRTFQCKGYEIEPLLEVFDLGPYPAGFDNGVEPCLDSKNGIGYMHIETAPTCHNKFIIH